MSPVLHRKIGHHHSFPPKIKDRVKERSIKPPQELTWIQTATLKLLENHMLQEKQVVVKVVRVRVASFARACLWCCWVFCLLSGCLFEKLGQRVIFSLISKYNSLSLCFYTFSVRNCILGSCGLWDSCLFQVHPHILSMTQIGAEVTQIGVDGTVRMEIDNLGLFNPQRA
ncbi:uncharacterized protein LOC102711259 isoform X1 [Oryza brachyantha]|uniref:uncharacterized protein LOC102711259 isoform X1 n=1 Tax=Oryza brachyantha TaxID=4533 RepID=UPI0007766601|nr:uncharacterized protein LOC102711259 isoform X1 [Oryza brachyantha]